MRSMNVSEMPQLSNKGTDTQDSSTYSTMISSGFVDVSTITSFYCGTAGDRCTRMQTVMGHEAAVMKTSGTHDNKTCACDVDLDT